MCADRFVIARRRKQFDGLRHGELFGRQIFGNPSSIFTTAHVRPELAWPHLDHEAGIWVTADDEAIDLAGVN